MMSLAVVTLFLSKAAIVVTPIGDQAPPELADIIIKPANHILVLRSLMTFCNIVIKTMVAVRLSMIAERMNAKEEKINSKPFWILF